MMTFTQQVDIYTKLSRNTSNTNVALGQELINIKQREILAKYPYKFLHDTYTLNTVAGTDTYTLPATVSRVNVAHIGKTDTLELVSKKRLFELEQASGRPYAYYIENNKITLYPNPDTTYTVKISYRKKIPVFNFSDVSNGTIDVTNGSAVVVGNSTSFNTNMVGKHILMPNGLWYEILSVSGTNLLNLTTDYDGLTETGQSYVIGQLSPLPEFEMLPVYLALADYFRSQEDGLSVSDRYEAKAQELQVALESFAGGASESVIIE